MQNILIHKNELKKDLFKKDVSPLREIVTITNINNLVLPRIPYKVDGVEYKDEVKQELKTKGDRIHFTKNKFDELSNCNTNFYDKHLKQILGAKIVFCKFADKPIVGDFSWLHINYEDYILLENQRGLTDNFDNIIISGNFDIRVRLSSAFRIAKVTSNVKSEKVEI